MRLANDSSYGLSAYVFTKSKSKADEIANQLIAGTVMKRPGIPIETAYAALFLASDEASYITGHTLDVNGGMYMG